jgi:hypothetical protein
VTSSFARFLPFPELAILAKVISALYLCLLATDTQKPPSN